jgi:hypothetical protein
VPWWGAAYFAVLAVASVAGLAVEMRRALPLWRVGADLLVGVLQLLFVWWFWHPEEAAEIGLAVVPLFLLALGWNAWHLPRDIERERPRIRREEGGGERAVTRLALGTTLLLLVPSLALGGLLACSALGWR